MIRLFLSDIDGCLSEPYAPFDLARLAEVRRAVQAGSVRGNGGVPAISLLTGRSFAYAEAYAQLLDTQVPVFFEAGAGRFDRATGAVAWHPAFSAGIEHALADVRAWVQAELVAQETRLAYDFGKRTQVGVASMEQRVVNAAAEEMRGYIARQQLPLQVFTTPISADIVPHGLSKAETLGWISASTEVPLHEMAFIGDSEGDVGALRAVGCGFAPANASAHAKAAARHVTPAAGVAGVLEALAHVVQQNEAGRGEQGGHSF